MPRYIVLLVIGSVLVLACALITARRPHEQREPEHEYSVVRIPHGRVLYAVVERNGVYFGDQRVDARYATDAANALLKNENARNFLIFGTKSARYGDVIKLHAGVDQSLIEWSTFHHLPIDEGTRKPLTGYFVPRCCHSVDVENEREDWDE